MSTQQAKSLTQFVDRELNLEKGNLMHDGWWGLVNAGWFGLAVGTILGLLSIWIGYILYKRGKQFTNLRYLARDSQLIGEASPLPDDGLEIRYDGHVVRRVVSTVAGLWNNGTNTILGSSIVENDPFRLKLIGDGRILRAHVQATHREVNEATVSVIDDQTVLISFDFLDAGDGFKIEVVHSGKVGDLSLTGTIRGLPNGAEIYAPGKVFERMLLGTVIMLISAGLLVLISLVGIALWSAFYEPWPKNIITFVCGLGAAGIMGLAFYESKIPRKARVVKGVPSAVTEDPRLFGQ